MNDNVTYLQPTEAPELQHILAANRAYTAAWQKGSLKFVPLIQESLERHMSLFHGCRQQLARDAQRLVAELTSDPLVDILDALEAGPDAELIGLAKDTRDSVLSRLERLTALLTRERNSLIALPAPNAEADKQLLLKHQQKSVVTDQQLKEEHAHEVAKLEAVCKAIDTLEANGLQTRFGGVVPSLAQLQALAVPGGQAVVAVEAASKAVEDLKVLLGDLIEGVRYEKLHSQRRAVQEKVNDLAQQLRELVRAQTDIQSKLDALEQLSGLLNLRQQWSDAINVLRLSLQAQQTRISTQPLANAVDIAALRQVLSTLLAFLRNLLDQDRRAL